MALSGFAKKSMNEAHFFLFHFYYMDLHNLSIEGFANTMPNPHTDFRQSIIKVKNVDFETLKSETVLYANVDSTVREK